MFLLIVYFVDSGFYYESLLVGRDENKGVFAKSRMFREKLNLNYEPFRSPLLPCVYGGTRTNSIVHQMNLRSALPAYWDCDIFFSSLRYYQLISSVELNKLKPLLSITAPIVRLYPKSLFLKEHEDSLTVLRQMSNSDLQDTILLEESHNGPPQDISRLMFERIFSGPPVPEKYFPSTGPDPKEIEESFYMKLFDRVITIPQKGFVEVSQGIYHDRMFRTEFPEHLKLGFVDSHDMLSRYFSPDFPIATDINGEIYYASRDRKSMMKFVSKKGLVVETSEEVPIFPAKIYSLHERSSPSKEASVTSFGPNTVGIETNTNTPEVLFYGDLYDRNWRAALDGRPAEVLIANYAFKAVALPQGRHKVIFRYEVPCLLPVMGGYFLCLTIYIILTGRSLLTKNGVSFITRKIR